ncbi:hypothetical protein BV898_08487 [Hypsibius exemplaris]|uniref:Uncharacterized protein n=1 Tax=Hypsibius exemplaris TaxID=2072580 RepID=A0A1W0WQB3_HYPEX|nr:hypothetical protein BV898_08487 [Hypsibius exemplaris]
MYGMKCPLSRAILKSARWKTNSSGIQKLHGGSSILFMLIYIVCLYRTATIRTTRCEVTDNVPGHNVSTSSTSSPFSSTTEPSKNVIPVIEYANGVLEDDCHPGRRVFFYLFCLLTLLHAGLCVLHINFVRRLGRQLAHREWTGQLNLREAGANRKRSRNVITCMLINMVLFTSLSHALHIRDIWECVVFFVLIENPLFGCLSYLTAWWWAWQGPQALN